MKRFILLLTMMVLGHQAQAATVSISVNSNGGPMFATSAGDLLTLGSCIRIGVFDTSGGNLTTLQTSNDYFAIDALFTPLGESGGSSGTITQAGNSGSVLMINDLFGTGNVLGQIANIDSAYLPAGQQLYAWFFNSAAPQGSEQWGIYTSTTGWNFPNGLGSETLSTFEIDTVIRGSTTGGLATTDRFSLSPVPEPGGSLLILAAGLVLRLRRTRRHTSF
jgi:hypothetical protein